MYYLQNNAQLSDVPLRSKSFPFKLQLSVDENTDLHRLTDINV